MYARPFVVRESNTNLTSQSYFCDVYHAVFALPSEGYQSLDQRDSGFDFESSLTIGRGPLTTPDTNIEETIYPLDLLFFNHRVFFGYSARLCYSSARTSVEFFFIDEHYR